MRLLIFLLLSTLLLVGQPGRVFAGSSTSVCGELLAQKSVFSWKTFAEGRGKPFLKSSDRLGLYGELRNLLLEQSVSWSEAIRQPAVKSVDMLVSDSAPFPDFSINKTGDLQARQFVFMDSDERVELPISEDSASCQNPAEKNALIALGRFATLAERAVEEISRGPKKEVFSRIENLEKLYDKYLYEGFPMFPWEALANSWLLTDKSIANGPPHNQLVLLHPAAGLVGAVGSDSATDVGAVLSIEPLGWIHYNKDYSSWYGASVISVFPSDRNAGIGVALNYNAFKLGVTWHDYAADAGYDDPTIFVGIELYQFLGKQQRKYEGYQKKVKVLLEPK